MRQKAHAGDVFLIPIDEFRFGIGQIVDDWKGELYIIIYDSVYCGENIDPNCVLHDKPLFAALSLDAKIFCGDWRVIGNITENIKSIPRPTFKVNEGGRVFLESRDRSVTRPASSSEIEYLRFRVVVAPIRLENALRAYNGVGEWIEKYEDLRYEYALKSSQYVSIL